MLWGYRINARGLGVCFTFNNMEYGILKEIDLDPGYFFLMDSGMGLPYCIALLMFQSLYFFMLFYH